MENMISSQKFQMRFFCVHIIGFLKFNQENKCNDSGTGSRKRYLKSTQHTRHQDSSWSFGKIKPRGGYHINVPRVILTVP